MEASVMRRPWRISPTEPSKIKQNRRRRDKWSFCGQVLYICESACGYLLLLSWFLSRHDTKKIRSLPITQSLPLIYDYIYISAIYIYLLQLPTICRLNILKVLFRFILFRNLRGKKQ